jgi:hypothetical protein
MDNVQNPYVLTHYMEDRFSNIARKNFTILVCGGESIIPEKEEFEYNFIFGELNKDNLTQQAIPNFKSYLTSNIKECPIIFW